MRVAELAQTKNKVADKFVISVKIFFSRIIRRMRRSYWLVVTPTTVHNEMEHLVGNMLLFLQDFDVI